MRLRTKTLLSLCALVCAACGRPGGGSGKAGIVAPAGYTAVSLGSGGSVMQFSSVPQSGGILVYAMRDTGEVRSYKLNDENHNLEIVLENGNYRFWAVGWSGAGLTGGVRCGKASAPNEGTGGFFHLTGQSLVEVPVDINQGNCGSDDFATSGYRSGSTFTAPDLVFCHAQTDTSAFTTSDDCSAGEESDRFFKGFTSGSGVNGADEGGYSSVAGRMFYRADMHEDERFELFSIATDGTNLVRQNPVMVSNLSSVSSAKLVPGTNKVVYRADQDTYGKKELYITTLGTQGSTKISGSIVGSGYVKDFRVTNDGAYVVFVGDMDTYMKEEVYAIKLSDLSRVKLNGAAAGFGVPNAGGGYQFKLSRNSTSVVFVGKFDNASYNEIYSATIAGAAGNAVKLHATSGNASFDVSYFDINSDGDTVIWQGDYYTDTKGELFASAIGSSTAVAISPGTVGNGSSGTFNLSPSADIVVFAQDLSGSPGIRNLYAANFSDLGAITITQLHTGSESHTQYKDFAFTPNNASVAYLANAGTSSTEYRIYSASVTGAANNKVDLTHAAYVDGDIETSSGGGYKYIRALDNTTVYFRAKGATETTDWALFRATVGSAGSGTLASQSYVAGVDMQHFSKGDGKVFFVNDPSTDGAYRLFSIPSTGSSATEISTGVKIDQVQRAHFLSEADDETGLSEFTNTKTVILEGKSTGSTSSDFYLLPDYSSANTATELVKMSRAYDGADGSGRFRISLLQFVRSPGGDLSAVTAAITSDCYAGPTADGNVRAAPPIYFPSGSGNSSSPFAMALDIFPGATDCSGTPQRILLPHGLSHTSSSASAAKLKVVSGGGLRLFVKD